MSDKPPQAPPHHPPLTTPHAASSSGSATHNPQAKIDQAEHGALEAITGVWNAFHGAGEALRGNILKGVDTIAGDRDKTGESIAQSGWEEIQQGEQKLYKR
ncbi:hypothetical protein FRB97_004170 [Tulasnella sp. 331]|nr:hypothetical protein FRB97_004170 [Tulasnella sp. 331]KAG8881885.1 hypothetical protein FRB98_004078 [Tulasnella sp. 332]